MSAVRRVLPAGLLLAATAVVVLSDAVPDRVANGVADVVLAATAAWAAVVLVGAWAAGRHGARTWLCFGAGLALFAVGRLVWLVDEVVLLRDPFPSAADGFFAAASVLAAVAFALAPGIPAGTFRRTTVVMDGALVATAGLLGFWVAAGQRLVDGSTVPALETAIGLSYPAVVSMAFSTVVVFVAFFDHRLPTSVAVRLLVGMGLMSAGAVWYGMSVVGPDPYVGGHPITLAWIAGTLLAGSAGRDLEMVPSRRPRAGIVVAVPYASVLAGLLAVGVAAAQDRLDGMTLVAAGLMLAVLGTRNAMTLRRYDRLVAGLSTSVEAGTVELQRERARFQALAKYSSDLVVVVAPDDTISWSSPSVERALAAEGADDLRDLLHPDDVEVVARTIALARSRPTGGALSGEARMRSLDGSVRNLELLAIDLSREEAVGGVVLTGRDVTDRRRLTDDLRWRAHHDALTGLANRELLRERLRGAIDASDPERRARTLVLDLDGFKTINDTLGHAAGDQLLGVVAERIRGCVRTGDLVARLGGDEFAVLLPVATDAEVDRVAARVVKALRAPYRLGDVEVLVHASAGVATHADELGVDDLLVRADQAMYVAKDRGGDRFVHFDASMGVDAGERMEMAVRLRRAIEARELRVVLQPIVDLETGLTAKVEALARWEDPVLGHVSPGVFVPLAEEIGLIARLGRVVLDLALADIARWAAVDPAGCPALSVNVSSRELGEPAFAMWVATALARHEVPEERLELELTERMLVDPSGPSLQNIETLRAAGVRVAVDDFGTGYSSLAQLHDLPVDVLKIDRAFVSQLDGSEADQESIASIVVRLGRTLGLSIVAEGVETAEQAASLRRLGCDQAQGWAFARPAPLEAWLPRGAAAAAA